MPPSTSTSRVVFVLLLLGTIAPTSVFADDSNAEKPAVAAEFASRLKQLRTKGPIGERPQAPQFPFDAATAAKYQRDVARWLGLPLTWSNELGMTFVLIPPGTFRMGSPPAEPGRNSGGYDETPCEITLSQPFYLSAYETTNGQFRRFVDAQQKANGEKYVTDIERAGGGNAHNAKAEWKHRPGTMWTKPGYAATHVFQDSQPVVHVSHTDANAFLKWLAKFDPMKPGETKADEMNLGAVMGVTYALPSEAEWEWACRAGAGGRYWWGDDEDTTGRVANVGDRSLKRTHPEWPRTVMPMDDGYAFTAPVGSYRANPFGLYDMLGNVWEFCSTHYGPYPKQPTTDPGHLDVKRGFAVRGGGWSNVAADVRCASRNADPPHFGHSNLGFRVAVRGLLQASQ